MARIVVDNLSIDYPVYSAEAFSLKRTILRFSSGGRIAVNTRHHVIVEALRHVSFELNDGDRVGLIGRNGAGKSTLLRAIAGVCAPTGGRIEIDGRLSFLFDVMSAMDPEATGYENIWYTATMLGIEVGRMRTLIADIEEFSELGDYLRLPLRTYSSGMQVRLSFALITSIDPDILLLDEAIGAGDTHFIHKAEQRAQSLYERTKIMVLASHSNEFVRQLCNKAMYLDGGHVVAFGPTDEVIDLYMRGDRYKAPTE